MAGRRVHIVMDEALVERIDAALPGGVSRGEFVRGAVERALDGSQQDVALKGAASGEMPAGSPPPAEQPVSRSAMFRRATQR